MHIRRDLGFAFESVLYTYTYSTIHEYNFALGSMDPGNTFRSTYQILDMMNQTRT